MKLLQILYPGLGGHSSVATSLISGDKENVFEHFLLGYGIEKPSENLKSYKLDYVIKRKGIDLRSFKKVYDSISKTKPDAIILHSTSQIFTVFVYSLFHKIKWVAVEHQANNAKNKVDWLYSFFILLLSPRIIYLTDFYKKEMQSRFSLLSKFKKISVIGNGVDLNRFVPKEKDKDDFFNISMISRFNKLRDHETLIRSFSQVLKTNFQARLIIAGEGETFDYIKNLCVVLNIQDKVSLLGFVNESQIIDLLQKSDLYVHSSLAETQSTSLLQVMACKVPIVATNINGINTLFSDGIDANLFEPGDIFGLTNIINKLIEDNETRVFLRNNSETKVNTHYSAVKMFEKYKDFLI